MVGCDGVCMQAKQACDFMRACENNSSRAILPLQLALSNRVLSATPTSTSGLSGTLVRRFYEIYVPCKRTCTETPSPSDPHFATIKRTSVLVSTSLGLCSSFKLVAMVAVRSPLGCT